MGGPREYHLLVLVHGLWGKVSHFDYISQELENSGAVILDEDLANAEDSCGLVVYRTRTNEGYFTYDGIDVCGTRAANEVCSVIDGLEEWGAVLTISVMGYSLGGLVSRYALGVLYRRGIFDKIKPRVFTTFCTPHVGVVVLGNKWHTRAFNSIGSMSMASTSRQLFLRDEYFRGKPLLQCMVEQDSRFYKALEMFDHLYLYANAAHDARCEWYTASINTTDPYTGRTDRLKGPYIDRYKPTILDATSLPQFANEGHAKRVRRTIWQNMQNRAVAAFKVVFVIPVWFVAFVINATFQNITSAMRQHSFRTAGLEEKVIEPLSRRASLGSLTDEKDMDQFLEEGANNVVESMYRAVHEDVSGALQLSPVQLSIIQGLNSLPWQKFPVLIRNHAHAHAAVIVRYKHPRFDEGPLIVKHWLEKLADVLE